MADHDRPSSVEHTLTIPVVLSPRANVQRVVLRALSGPDETRVFTNTDERCLIGTHPSVHVQLDDPTVSRFHCELTVHPDRVVLADLGSRNGTFVNGVRVERCILHEGAVIEVGGTQLRIETGAGVNEVSLSSRAEFGTMVGISEPMRRAFAVLERAAQSDVTVLLSGETGTGKEAAAESIHEESPRKGGPFVVVDCSAIPPSLLESELFGHEKGAFTGATGERQGAFQAAHGGTVFLDEVGELPIDLQPKLLRALEKRQVKPVGATAYRNVDVRVVAATNRNLKAEVNERAFRSDLYVGRADPEQIADGAAAWAEEAARPVENPELRRAPVTLPARETLLGRLLGTHRGQALAALAHRLVGHHQDVVVDPGEVGRQLPRNPLLAIGRWRLAQVPSQRHRA